jgi:hypothetical protein
VKGVAIYIEGGGDSTDGKAQLRRGFEALFARQKEKARAKRMRWRLVLCGGRNSTADAFLVEDKTCNDQVVVLLVDSEAPITDQRPEGRIAHLRSRDRWDLRDEQAERIHLMTQCMEAWIVSDGDALKNYYGKDFQDSALPKRVPLDDEPKRTLCEALKTATKRTQKREYGKIKHAGELLQKIDPTKVEKRCTSFANLVTWLDQAISAA